MNTTPLNRAWNEANNFPATMWSSSTGPLPVRIIEAFSRASNQESPAQNDSREFPAQAKRRWCRGRAPGCATPAKRKPFGATTFFPDVQTLWRITGRYRQSPPGARLHVSERPSNPQLRSTRQTPGGRRVSPVKRAAVNDERAPAPPAPQPLRRVLRPSNGLGGARDRGHRHPQPDIRWW